MRWLPIETAPKDGSWILLRGRTGYIRTPYRVHVGHWDAEYRPKSPWQTSERCSFTDDGDSEGPTHWSPLENPDPQIRQLEKELEEKTAALHTAVKIIDDLTAALKNLIDQSRKYVSTVTSAIRP